MHGSDVHVYTCLYAQLFPLYTVTSCSMYVITHAHPHNNYMYMYIIIHLVQGGAPAHCCHLSPVALQHQWPIVWSVHLPDKGMPTAGP